LRLARQRLAVLAIETHAEIDRQAILRNRVADVEVRVVGAIAAAALAEHLRLQVAGALIRKNAVAGPQRSGDRIGRAVADAELDVVRRAHARQERLRVDVDDLLRTDVEALAHRAVRLGGDEIAAG